MSSAKSLPTIGGVERITVSAAVVRDMPDQIPVIVLGRLAVNLTYPRRRLGISLLRDAMLRAMSVASGAACLYTSCPTMPNKFYLNHGSRESLLDTMTLLLPSEPFKRMALMACTATPCRYFRAASFRRTNVICVDRIVSLGSGKPTNLQ